VGAVDDRPDYDYTAGTTFRGLQTGRQRRLPRAPCRQRGEPGVELHVSRKGEKWWRSSKAARRSSLEVPVGRGQEGDGPQGGTAAAQPLGVVITARYGARNLQMTLASTDHRAHLRTVFGGWMPMLLAATVKREMRPLAACRASHPPCC